jgi:hypothetical protein
MTVRRGLVLAGLAAMTGCAQLSDRIILLPGPDGQTGAVAIQALASGASVRLAQPYAQADIRGGRIDTGVTDRQRVDEAYGDLSLAQPARPRTFVVRFQANSEQLTPDSLPILAEALALPTASGPSRCPPTALWGAQTARSLHFFAIGDAAHAGGRRPCAGLGEVGRGAGQRRARPAAGPRAHAIAAAARVADGEFDAEFPLSVWQTGSGTQSNMNVNEVIASLASERASSAAARLRRIVHPNDEVNRGQSSNDVFPRRCTSPRCCSCASTFGCCRRWRWARSRGRPRRSRGAEDRPHPPAGRHAGDAGPGVRRLRRAARLCRDALRQALPAVHALAIGGTAVGTGLNTHPEFGERVARAGAARLGCRFVGAATCSPRWPATRRWWSCTARCACWPSR